ncbi:MAG: GDP-mannose 4,6-dehydratase [Chloroflexi bacterium]|nr:MAG: putative UDP-glucuronate decarboxylase [Chloroflexi bacterium OLB13]MBC6956368.1 NAD-dependent epimerase/dehydratase family protein [Chloroflexota bacterium]MBV6436412.1 Bifunctional polymyxin resistance protein ArnA [Anaerolineae bacterium]MDL1917505.1 NAD-dependent epimerase/dehydratase family protein [Anaerolineae bacterium CFX4]MBW7880867.1 GDP-mannose 4,6-dehydratase [Anaerolineae bacterium]
MTHALITGGAGFVGSHLAEKLIAAGQTVTVIDDLSTGRMSNLANLIKHPRFRFAIEDIRNTIVLDRLVSECDIIYHLAAAVGVQKIVSHPIETIEINIGGSEVVFKTAARYRKKVMLASTSEVYGKGVKFPFEEDDDSLLGPTTRSRWSYAASKAIDEFLGLAYHKEVGLPVTVFRLFNTVGPRQSGQYGMVVPRFVRWALNHQPIQVYGDGQQQRCFGNVFDVVDAISRLAEVEDAEGQVFNIGSDEEISIVGLAERVRERSDSASEISLIPYEQAYEPGFEDFRRRVPSLDKIKRVIGWRPTTALDTTIDQIISYIRENPNG